MKTNSCPSTMAPTNSNLTEFDMVMLGYKFYRGPRGEGVYISNEGCNFVCHIIRNCYSSGVGIIILGVIHYFQHFRKSIQRVHRGGKIHMYTF